MSTRGCVAWREKDGTWKGVYNHSDSYPTWLGAEVWEWINKLGAEAVIRRLKSVGDWREFESGGVCQYCGKVAGQPHSISGVMGGFAPWTRRDFVAMRKEHSRGRPDLWTSYQREIATLDEIEANRRRTGFPDPSSKHHQHGDGKADQFDPRHDALFMEWVYLIDPDRDVMEVWHAMRSAKRSHDVTTTGIIGEAGYTHAKAGECVLGRQEPDWQALEDVRTIRNE